MIIHAIGKLAKQIIQAMLVSSNMACWRIHHWVVDFPIETLGVFFRHFFRPALFQYRRISSKIGKSNSSETIESKIQYIISWLFRGWVGLKPCKAIQKCLCKGSSICRSVVFANFVAEIPLCWLLKGWKLQQLCWTPSFFEDRCCWKSMTSDFPFQSIHDVWGCGPPRGSPQVPWSLKEQRRARPCRIMAIKGSSALESSAAPRHGADLDPTEWWWKILPYAEWMIWGVPPCESPNPWVRMVWT